MPKGAGKFNASDLLLTFIITERRRATPNDMGLCPPIAEGYLQRQNPTKHIRQELQSYEFRGHALFLWPKMQEGWQEMLTFALPTKPTNPT